MTGFLEFVGRLLRGALRLALALALAVFVLSLLAATLLVLLGVTVWSLLTGRKPAAATILHRFRQTSQRYTQGVWTRGDAAAGRSMGDVVDVPAREVPDAPGGASAAGKAGGGRAAPDQDPMARMSH